MSQPLDLVRYLVAYEGEELPPIEAPLYEYVLAGNGVFVRGRRQGLEVLMPVRECEVRGLAYVESYVKLDAPRVPEGAVVAALDISRNACADGVKREALFWLWPEGGSWRMEVPAQDNSGATVKPLGANEEGSNYERTLVDLHSHHDMAPFFSFKDDEEEQGFRLYAVLGNIFTAPALHIRVGLYGHHWRIPASWVFELPEFVVDALEPPEQPEPEGKYDEEPEGEYFDEALGLWLPRTLEAKRG